ncbi:hypothetical protein [Luteolibacter sp. Populi]|uniref:hypothetical protein n=1 Tax=Luteolibacter sp. Populi TaxID=3230487 RepID=UPI0034675ECB
MKRTAIAIAILLSLGALLHAGELAYKLYLPDRENRLTDRKVELIARCMEAYDLPPLLLPRAASDEEFAENMIREFRKSILGLGVDPDKILASLEARGWSGAGPEIEAAMGEHRLIFEDSVLLRQPVGGVGEIRVFVITRGFSWQIGKVLVDDSRGGGRAKIPDWPSGTSLAMCFSRCHGSRRC